MKAAKGRRRSKYDPRSSRRIPPQVDPNGPEARKSMTKVDFTGVQAGFEPVERGQYPVTFSKGEVKDSKSTPGAKVVNVELTITDEGGEEASGRKLFDNWSLQPKALWKMKGAALAFGCDPALVEGEVDTDEVIEDLVGREAIVDVDIDKYTDKNGRERERNVVVEYHEVAVGSFGG